jgi:hypothetical protein
MNTVMNENWRELVREMAPPISEALKHVVKMILTNLFEHFPFDETFPETL